MITVLIPPVLKSLPKSRKLMVAPVPLRWTCEEFHAIGDAGFFEGRRAMLFDGVILEQGTMNPPHAVACELADNELRRVFGPGWRIRCQLPLQVGKATDPLP